MPLTFLDIKNAKPTAKPYRLSDGGSLYFLVQPNGNAFRRYRYRFSCIEKMLAIGSLPATSLAQARSKRDEAKRLLDVGKDPSIQRKLDKLALAASQRNTFGLVAAAFLENMKANRAAPGTHEKTRGLLEDIAALLAPRPISDISAAELLDLLKRVERSMPPRNHQAPSRGDGGGVPPGNCHVARRGRSDGGT